MKTIKIDLTTSAKCFTHLREFYADDATLTIAGVNETRGDVDAAISCITGIDSNEFANLTHQWEWPKNELIDELSEWAEDVNPESTAS